MKWVILAAALLAANVAHARGGIVAPLANKISSIQHSCKGTRIVSAVRHTRIAGTRRISLHAYGKAVDVKGNYRCIYAQLKRWPGGYSVDAGRVKHIHISYDYRGREWGTRFRHGAGRSYYAKRRYHLAMR